MAVAFETILGYGSDAVRKSEPEQKKDEDEEGEGEFDWAIAMNDDWLQGGTMTADAGIAMCANHFYGFVPREHSLILRCATLRPIR
jgi:hypothetical protein